MTGSLLDRAQAGDTDAFADIVAVHRRELHLHCYRMLGSLSDAEDLVQETLTAAWRGMAGFAGRSSIRAWLYSIATNRCLNAIRGSKRRPPVEPVPPFHPPEPSRHDEVTWLQPYPDAWLDQAAEDAPDPAERAVTRETVELAFIAALQRLPARQTAALLLCDVLGFATADVAAMLDTSATAVKGLVQRARAQDISTARHDPAPEPGSLPERQLARRFAAAFTEDDLDGVVTLLTDDAWLAMPPAPHEYRGPAPILTFLRASANWRDGRRFQLVPTRANRQPAFGCYLADSGQPSAQPTDVLVLTLAGDRIRAITRFMDRGLPALFGLPDTIIRATHASQVATDEGSRPSSASTAS